MKKSSLTAAIFLAALAITAQTAHAATAAELKTTIEAHAGGGLSAAVSGNTVTVTGTKTGATTTLYLNIDAGVTVNWQASLTGSTENDSGTLIPLISNNGTGTFEVQSGKIEQTSNGSAVESSYNNGTVNITGGTVSATTGSAVYNQSSGTVNISGGTVSATTSSRGAVYNSSTGKITVSGTAKVTSANTYTGTIGTQSYPNATDTWLEIKGGTVENTAANGNAVYNEAGGILLSGNPSITGTIMKVGKGVLSVDGSFAPSGGKTYTLGFTNYSGIAVTGGASKIANFTLANSSFDGINFALSASGSNLVLAATNGYAVAASGTTYTVTKGTGTYVSIQDVIDYIRTQANGAARTIQFGNGSAVLDIGTEYITFDGSATPAWGLITLTGKITTAGSYSIYLDNGASISSTADIANTRSYGRAVHNQSSGTVNISSGTVSATGYAVFNVRGTVNISGGTVENTAAGNAVYSGSTGKITVSGTAKVTSANTNTTEGTIVIVNYGTADTPLEIKGGTVENTAAGNAVRNESTGAVNISGGVVRATTGYAVYKNSTGTTTLTGGLAFAYGTAANNVIYGDYTNTSGNAAVLAWDNTKGTTYTAFTSDNITKTPTGATARWLNKDGKAGIDYANGANTGFIELAGVTVNKIAATPAPTFPTASGITYDPSKTLSQIALSGGSGAGTFAWTTGTTIPTVTNSGYSVTFTPTDAENYNTATQSVSLAVAKANPAATFPTAAAITYGAALSTSALTGGTGAGTFAWQTPATVPIVANSGYSVTFTPTDATNYNTLTQTVNITVAKANPAATFPTAAAITYGAALSTSALTGGTGTGTFAWTSGTTIPTVTNSGYSVTFTPTDAENYNAATQNVSLAVAKAKITKPAATSHTYNGTEQSAGIAANAAYTIEGNTTGTNASNYAATVALKDKANYEWADGTTTDLALAWNISKASGLTAPERHLMISASNTNPNTFDLSSITLSKTDHGTLSYTLGTFTDAANVLAAPPTLAGTTLSYTGTGKTSGAATQAITIASQNYTDATVILTLGATSKTIVAIGGLTEQNSTYDGTAKLGVSGIATSGAYTGVLIYEYEGTGLSGVSTEPPANAGDYTLTVSVPQSDPDYAGSEIYAFIIEKAKIAKPSAASLVYTGSEQTGIAANAAYTATGDKGTNANNYTATVALKDKANYEWADGTDGDLELAWTIAKAAIAKPTVANTSLVYTGAEQSAGIAANAAYTATGDKQTNAGSHAATVALKDKANYEWADGTDDDLTLPWTIAKANPATPANLTATAGQTLASVTLPAGWEWATPTAPVGEAGTQTHKANFTPSDANYNAATDIDVSVAVAAETPIRSPQIASGNIRVQATANAIVLENLPKNAKVEVYNLQGKRIYFSNSGNSQILKIQVQTKGMYVVKAGNETVRVAMR